MKSSESSTAILSVAIDCPVDKLFDYIGPRNAKPGCRVRVNFGRKQVTGLVMAVGDETDIPKERLKRVTAQLDETPIFGEGTLRLMRWAARYYSAPIGEVTRMFPRLLRLGRPLSCATTTQWSLEKGGGEGEGTIRGSKQKALVDLLTREGGPMASQDIDARIGGGWRPAAKRLCELGILRKDEVEKRAAATCGPLHEIRLEPEQEAAKRAVVDALGRFETFLLEGVTGSGKTEVFITAAREALERGMQVLVLVPEIALTPQTLARFRRSLPTPVVALHSGMTDTERLESWAFAARAEAGVVIGTRSACFVEMPKLGLIVVDEEHDTSLKQSQTGRLRYSARDCSVMRGRELGIPVVLASATPSLESIHNADEGRYRHLKLGKRAAGARMPQVKLIDMSREGDVTDGVSGSLLRAMRSRLEAGEQVLVFLNRRGFAPVLVCSQCGWSAKCPSCDAHAVLHKASQDILCHHCGHRETAPARCPSCGSSSGLFPAGEGTQRVEQRLRAAFPEFPLVRMDRDAIRNPHEMESAIGRMRSGEARILLGTQMVTTGHDFSGVTLVGVIGMDGQLFSIDFRSVERMAQKLIQVAGRAGRGERPGTVMVQTRYPEHHVMQALKSEGGGYREVAEIELAARRQAGMPPFGHVAVTLAKSPRPGEAMAFLRSATECAPKRPGVTVFGPMTTIIERIGGEYRAQVVIESRQRGELHRYLREWVPAVNAQRAPRTLNWTIDVDPIEVQ